MDNYTDSGIDTVLLHSLRRSDKKKEDLKMPVFQLKVEQEYHMGSYTPHFKLIGAKLLELVVKIDTKTLSTLITDLLIDLEFKSSDDHLAEDYPDKWIQKYSMNISSTAQRLKLVDVYRAQLLARAEKIYFEYILLHPVKILVTFQKSLSTTTMNTSNQHNQNSLSSRSLKYLELLPTIAAVTDMPIKINSFIVEDALESSSTLIARISSNAMQHIQGQLLHLLGSYFMSLSVLGRPAGLLSNIGHGVHDFFYEPYEGLLQSPGEFIKGLTRGTGSLVTSVVSGALNSTASIVESASDTLSRGMTFLDYDEEHAKRRAIDRQRREAEVAKGGLLVGLREGGGSVVTGLTSGITGLVNRPMDEAKKDGAVGFLRGVGLGLVGVAVKPVIGVTEALGSVAQGLSSQVSENTAIWPCRPPRALERVSLDSQELVLVPVDVRAASVQRYILSKARDNEYDDIYMGYFPIAHSAVNLDGNLERSGSAVAMSERILFWFIENSNTINEYRWREISHIQYSDYAIGIILYAPDSGGNGKVIQIPCPTKEKSKKLYKALYTYAPFMGNANACIPPDKVQDTNNIQNIQTKQNNSKDRIATSPVQEKVQYKYGTINGRDMGRVTEDEKSILAIGKEMFRNTSTSEPARLDECMWRLISAWDKTHNNINTSRCCLTAIINNSDAVLSIISTELREGKDTVVFGTFGFDFDSRSISPGGCAIIFAYGYCPSLVSKAHVKVDVDSTAFRLTMSTRPDRTSIDAIGGFYVGFLEKSLTDWWAKYVIEVK